MSVRIELDQLCFHRKLRLTIYFASNSSPVHEDARPDIDEEWPAAIKGMLESGFVGNHLARARRHLYSMTPSETSLNACISPEVVSKSSKLTSSTIDHPPPVRLHRVPAAL
jgi:hypothetical protein